MKNIDVLDFLNGKYPLNLSCSWDNCGLLVGELEDEINKIFVCLDITSDIINEAIKNNVNLIVTHHPIIFHPLKVVTSNSLVYKLISAKISVISIHTNLDIANGGINDILIDKLDSYNVTKLSHSDKEAELIRVAKVNTIETKNLINNVKEKLNLQTIKSNKVNKKINTIAVCSGSGGDFIPLIIKNNIDAYITSEISHDKFILANEENVVVLDCGHFETENIIMDELVRVLRENFLDFEIDVPKNNVNPALYY